MLQKCLTTTEKYDIGLYTALNIVDSSVKDIVDNYQDINERSCSLGDTVYMMQKCSKYKMAPFSIKNKYWYATTDISSLLVSENVYVTHEDMSYYSQLLTNGLRIRDRKDKVGAFRFYYLYGAHMPYVMSEEGTYTREATMIGQAKGCMRIVYEYIEQMKALGIYDDATIIITADHGQNTYLEDVQVAKQAGFEVTSNPILFVKQRGESGKEYINISMAPVSHEEFIPTVLSAMNVDSSQYSRTFEEIQEDEKRSRIFIYGRHYDFPFKKYQINGNVREIGSWELIPDFYE